MTGLSRRYGIMAHKRGEHFVMPQREADGSLRYGVWRVERRARNGEGTAFKLAEFHSARHARNWCDLMNEMRGQMNQRIDERTLDQDHGP